jgi:hypothetical protein
VHLSDVEALDWFTGQLRRLHPSVTVRPQSELARARREEIVWYVNLPDERFRIDFALHVPLAPSLAFEVYVERVTDWQRAVALRPVALIPGLVGSEYEAVYRFLGRAYEGTFRIVAADPPKSISIEAAGSGIAVTYTTTFAPEEGGTSVSVKGDYSLPDHLLARVADRLGLERAITRDIQRANDAYRRLCEEISRSPD